ncbi:alpha/beta fold hydrolase [Specibacter cremeus]|uniref:alpha/beta fold hydrolase n=1 Tax=Specibacter cremeus TaxID=1629051 RepID=UPI000F779F45|nr:alpha/beta hydrolase [Specibacter cremeus]
MNCTADLWSGCGFDDALTPHLDEASIDGQVDKLLDVLPPRFALAGLSLGGIVAMALTRRAPQRVAGLCLISTNAKAPTQQQREGWRLWRDRLAAGESARDLQRDILDALLSVPARERDAGLVERALRMGDETGTTRLDTQLRMQETRIDESTALGALRVPVLVLSGTADAICPPRFHEDIAAATPGARLVLVDAGHLAPMERPHIVGRLIRGWLAQAQSG